MEEDNDDSNFIYAVKAHPELYNPRTTNYAQTAKKSRLWKAISDQFSVDAKRKWKDIRDRYVREKRKSEQKMAYDEDWYPVWRYYPILKFIDKFIRKRKGKPPISRQIAKCSFSENDEGSKLSGEDGNYSEINTTFSLGEINLKNKCGQIYFENKKLIFSCDFCETLFVKADTYLQHILDFHNCNEETNIDNRESESDMQNIENTQPQIKSEYKAMNNENSSSYMTEKNYDPLIEYEVIEDINYNAPMGMDDLSYINDDYKQNTITNIQLNSSFTNDNDYENEQKTTTSTKSISKMETTNSSGLPERIQDDQGRFMCTICDIAYIRYENLVKHNTNIHRNSTEKAYQCNKCEKSFESSYSLYVHDKLHGSEKKYTCEFCAEKFTRRYDKIVHERKYHSQHTVHKPYECDECDKSFMKYSEMIVHKNNIHHSDEMPETFDCEICHNKFSNLHSLNDHKLIHSGVRPYKCEICSIRFHKLSNLNIHKKIHFGKQSFLCKICGTKFLEGAELLIHMKTHKDVFDVNRKFIHEKVIR